MPDVVPSVVYTNTNFGYDMVATELSQGTSGELLHYLRKPAQGWLSALYQLLEGSTRVS